MHIDPLCLKHPDMLPSLWAVYITPYPGWDGRLRYGSSGMQLAVLVCFLAKYETQHGGCRAGRKECP